MTQTKTAPEAEATPRREPAKEESLPTWRKTRPPANPEPDQGDLARSVERMEAVLGR